MRRRGDSCELTLEAVFVSLVGFCSAVLRTKFRSSDAGYLRGSVLWGEVLDRRPIYQHDLAYPWVLRPFRCPPPTVERG